MINIIEQVTIIQAIIAGRVNKNEDGRVDALDIQMSVNKQLQLEVE